MSGSTSRLHADTSSVHIPLCSLCQKALSPDNEIIGDLPTNGVCSDCKFLLLEDFGNPQRRHRGRFRHHSSESVENILSQQLSYTVRQNQSTSSVEDNQVVDGDAPAWSLHYGSTHTTPSGSRSWRRVLSDTDSDGFDNWGSLYDESESNASFRRFVGTDMFNLRDEADELDSDTDIDPMHAGLGQWNIEDDDEEDEEDDEEEEREWERAEEEEAEATTHLQNFFTSSPSESRGGINWEQRFNSTVEGMVNQRIRDSWRVTYNNDHNSFTNLDDTDLLPTYERANFGDYLDARNFEELLEHLAENDNTRRGAPPAALSFVSNLPLVVIGNEELEKHGEELVCAICKDVLTPGTKVNQLPCSHLYHTCCILPWLSARNSCPLCRYELPTDDKDYEEGKQNSINSRNVIHDVMEDDSSPDVSDEADMNEEDGGIQPREPVSSGSSVNSSATRGDGRWFFLAAAPIVSLVGIVLVFWLGNNPQNQIEGCRNLDGHSLSGQNHHELRVYASADQRESRSRRWWFPF
ncbi:putative aminoacyltransferase, E1 ubiquitin-activating enzyme [Lupinus albus]|uniref:RING-type E3 ubiquitin transferase n=1 Tax=Lupinus albus TaxID=3870 RepID=A0A6A4QV38_LUPAL|nr:putative aminoacyltransferase, E1 ubiquitin-activating enzyme [Lupinus albus]